MATRTECPIRPALEVVEAIAQYASENLPVEYYPESIIVRIVTADSGNGTARRPEITTAIFSVAKPH